MHPNFPRLERTLAAMRDLAVGYRVQPIILIIPTKAEVYRWILEQRTYHTADSQSSHFAVAILQACARAGVRCLDLKPYLTKEGRRLYEDSNEFLWWLDDTHWNHRGHEAVAAFVEQRWLRNGTSQTSP